MRARRQFTIGDAAAVTPLGCFVLLLLYGGLSSLNLVGGFAAKRLVVLGADLTVVVPLTLVVGSAMASFIAAGATGMCTLLHTLGDLVEAKWRFADHKRHLSRTAVCAAGFCLCWFQLCVVWSGFGD